MNFFSKSPKKSKKTPTSEDEGQPPPPSTSTSHPHRSRSPPKKSSSSRSSGKARDENQGHGRKAEQGSPRISRSFPKSNNSPRHPFDPNTTHPLNLPPDQLRRFSALSAMSDQDKMNVDVESPRDAPNSPPPQARSPPPSEPPKANGSNGTGAPNIEGPAPPPHRSNPTSPVASPPSATPEEAEEFKTAGNAFYKNKDYKRAIEQYTKGKLCPLQYYQIFIVC